MAFLVVPAKIPYSREYLTWCVRLSLVGMLLDRIDNYGDTEAEKHLSKIEIELGDKPPEKRFANAHRAWHRLMQRELLGE